MNLKTCDEFYSMLEENNWEFSLDLKQKEPKLLIRQIHSIANFYSVNGQNEKSIILKRKFLI